MYFDCHKSGRWLAPSMTTFFSFIILCLISLANGTDKGPQVYKAGSGKVILKPPKLTENSTLFVTKNEIFITWEAPDVYPWHIRNNNSIEDNSSYLQETNSSSVDGTTVSTVVSNVTFETPNEQTTAAPEKGDNSASLNATKIELTQPKCLTEDQFRDIDHLEVLVKSVDAIVNFAKQAGADSSKRENGTLIQVDFDKGCVERYIVNYVKEGSADVTVAGNVSAAVTEFNITGLTEETNYTLFITAYFTSGHHLNSNNWTVATESKDKIDCHCSFFGKLPNTTCSTSTYPWCKCKPNYTGAFCELCRPGFYRSAPYFPCHRCPCSPHATISHTCHYREGYLVCNQCKPTYTGHLCQSCTNGYYRYHGLCVQCFCNFNNDPKMSRICDPYTGACTKCINNTTGIHCQECMKGYVREKAEHKHCIPYHESKVAANDSGPSKGLIAAICIAVILALCAVVGFAVYRHWKIFPPRKPFWTVELKEDHDGVNFSAVPGQEYVQHDAADVQDLEFYEKHRGKNSGKSVSTYSKLNEDI